MDIHFIVANILIGITIGIDGVLATIFQFHKISTLKRALTWSLAIGSTHWIFPMFGFMGGWYLTEYNSLKWFVYATGALLLLYLIISIINEACDKQQLDTNNTWLSSKRFLLIVLAVSWDALISGPGKTVIAENWTNVQIFISFAIVGLVVFISVILACYPALILNKKWQNAQTINSRFLSRLFFNGIIAEIMLFSGFMFLAVHNILSSLSIAINPDIVTLLLWLLFNAVVIIKYGKTIRKTQHGIANQFSNKRS